MITTKEQTKTNGHPKTKEQPQEFEWAGKVPHIKQGTYSDGLPYNELNYLAFKLILKPNRFTSRASLLDLVKVMKKPLGEAGVDFKTDGFLDAPVRIREVLFVDTPDFRLYNNGFILRRRIIY